MADESKTGNLPPSKNQSGEKSNTMSDAEIGQLSDLISDPMASGSKEYGDDTASFSRASDEDTGEFKPHQD